jgi:hypothetical protein
VGYNPTQGSLSGNSGKRPFVVLGPNSSAKSRYFSGQAATSKTIRLRKISNFKKITSHQE